MPWLYARLVACWTATLSAPILVSTGWTGPLRFPIALLLFCGGMLVLLSCQNFALAHGLRSRYARPKRWTIRNEMRGVRAAIRMLVQPVAGRRTSMVAWWQAALDWMDVVPAKEPADLARELALRSPLPLSPAHRQAFRRQVLRPLGWFAGLVFGIGAATVGAAFAVSSVGYVAVGSVAIVGGVCTHLTAAVGGAALIVRRARFLASLASD